MRGWFGTFQRREYVWLAVMLPSACIAPLGFVASLIAGAVVWEEESASWGIFVGVMGLGVSALVAYLLAKMVDRVSIWSIHPYSPRP